MWLWRFIFEPDPLCAPASREEVHKGAAWALSPPEQEFCQRNERYPWSCAGDNKAAIGWVDSIFKTTHTHSVAYQHKGMFQQEILLSHRLPCVARNLLRGCIWGGLRWPFPSSLRLADWPPPNRNWIWSPVYLSQPSGEYSALCSLSKYWEPTVYQFLWEV